METASILRKLRQIEEHARALAHQLSRGHSQNRARLIWNLASHLAIDQERKKMEHQDLSATLQQIEALARELGKELPPGLPRHRAQHMAAVAASAALDVRLTRRAANDAEKEFASTGGD